MINVQDKWQRFSGSLSFLSLPLSLCVLAACVTVSHCVGLGLQTVFPEGGNANVCVHNRSCTVIISVCPREMHRYVKEGSVSLPHQGLSHLTGSATWFQAKGKSKCTFEIMCIFAPVIAAILPRALDKDYLGGFRSLWCALGNIFSKSGSKMWYYCNKKIHELKIEESLLMFHYVILIILW